MSDPRASALINFDGAHEVASSGTRVTGVNPFMSAGEVDKRSAVGFDQGRAVGF